MHLRDPEQIYSSLLEKLFGVREKVQHRALRQIGKKLHNLDDLLTTKTKSRLVRILVIDEIDFLMTKNQEVLYNIF